MIKPRATYRLQFRNGMTFEKAAAQAGYLAKLGVSHLYASPIFAAAPGSTHGYDIVDLNRLAPDLGGDAGFQALVAALKKNGLGLILDFVPNHMGASTHNPWWFNVLEWGAASPFAQHFDIDWSAPKLIVPALASNYGEELAKGAFDLSFDPSDGGICFSYGELKLPLTPPTYAQIFSRIDGEVFAELARRFIAVAPEDAASLKMEIADAAADPAVLASIKAALSEVRSDLEAIHALHEAQAWRLTYWRAARETLTYRRFFEISDLVGLKVERSGVFDDVHAKLLKLVEDGSIDGIRLDHIDGLAEPKGYLEKLQAAVGGSEPFYLLVEKILGPGEHLRREWPVAGTTGYEFIRALADLLVDPAGEPAMTQAYHRFIGGEVDYDALVLEHKRRMLARNLAGELEALKDMAGKLAGKDPMTRDFGADTLRRAMMELVAALPVYRTYVDVAGPSQEDRDVLQAAVEAAKATREVEDEAALTFLMRMLLLELAEPEAQAEALEFASRFQQTTGPVMAKALEDTVFYRYNRLAGLNEVGGEPNHFGAAQEVFHEEMSARLASQPLGLSATSTHDTKRGEDARARLYVLSEMPKQWTDAVQHWAQENAPLRTDAAGLTFPDRETEWLFYQALLGAWPLGLDIGDGAALEAFAGRMTEFMLKAVKEAKAYTSWTAQDPDYENAVEQFAKRALDPGTSGNFLRDFEGTCSPIFVSGALNGLTQTLIKLTAPGVPDLYQAAELWDFSLVDPDNRRPVDFDRLGQMLHEAQQADPAALLRDWRSGAIKMHVTRAALAFRAEAPELFAEGAYIPLDVEGRHAQSVTAYARTSGPRAAITIVPRLTAGLLKGQAVPMVPQDAWGDTRVMLPAELSHQTWVDRLCQGKRSAGAEMPISLVLSDFPVALLSNTTG